MSKNNRLFDRTLYFALRRRSSDLFNSDTSLNSGSPHTLSSDSLLHTTMGAESFAVLEFRLVFISNGLGIRRMRLFRWYGVAAAVFDAGVDDAVAVAVAVAIAVAVAVTVAVLFGTFSSSLSSI